MRYLELSNESKNTACIEHCKLFNCVGLEEQVIKWMNETNKDLYTINGMLKNWEK
tara:strand:- start:235 stop:399 length:165 start_codon:yes stop_codon:yes gene_type:complete